MTGMQSKDLLDKYKHYFFCQMTIFSMVFEKLVLAGEVRDWYSVKSSEKIRSSTLVRHGDFL